MKNKERIGTGDWLIGERSDGKFQSWYGSCDEKFKDKEIDPSELFLDWIQTHKHYIGKDMAMRFEEYQKFGRRIDKCVTKQILLRADSEFTCTEWEEMK